MKNMKKIDVRHVAKIARLDLTDEEAKKFQKNLDEILAAFSELDKADVKGVEPALQPIPTKNVLRSDTPEQSLTQEEALKNTKHKKDGFFKGPRAV
ncbi:MAG: Asp-tRNA(Asn)/Glu-tRNA(Gln) amidotransferase subunit GatC [Candidatus Aenigmatarchaeota archaeon]